MRCSISASMAEAGHLFVMATEEETSLLQKRIFSSLFRQVVLHSKDKIDFYEVKRLKEHIAITVFIGVCMIGVFAAGLIMREALVCCLAVLMLIAAHGWRNNAMMA